MSGPALSYERVDIRYGRRCSILISPERRAEFPIDLEIRRQAVSLSGLIRSDGPLKDIDCTRLKA